jgi:DNA-binding NarL/FixJ family response regulator
MEAKRLRVVLAEDHPAVAAQLRSLLDAEFEIVAVVGDGRALVAAVARFAPDVIITDIAMPILDGMAAAREIRGSNANARIVFVTVMDDEATITQSLATGALGYVSKTVAGDELVPAVRAAVRGDQYVARGPPIRPRELG